MAEALGGPGYDGVSSGRVRDVPDLRTIRYYTTLGLLDRPAEMRGRTALYGRRHLLQLVAIKRLQARGLSLAEVQERVVGLSDAALRRLAAAEAVAAGTAAQPPASASRRNRSGASSQNWTKIRPAKKAPVSNASPGPRPGVIAGGGPGAGRGRPWCDPHGGGPFDRNPEAARADRRRPGRTTTRRRAMTMTRSRPLPLLDEAARPSVDDSPTATTPASAPGDLPAAGCRWRRWT